MPGKDWGLRGVGSGHEHCVGRYIAVSAEMLAQHTVVWLADFAFLDQTVRIKATKVQQRSTRTTNLSSLLKVKRITASIRWNWSSGSLMLHELSEYGGNQKRKKNEHTQRTGPVCLEERKAFSMSFGTYIGMRQHEVAFNEREPRGVPT